MYCEWPKVYFFLTTNSEHVWTLEHLPESLRKGVKKVTVVYKPIYVKFRVLFLIILFF